MWQKLPSAWRQTLTWGALIYWVVAGVAVHGLHTCGSDAHGDVCHLHHVTAHSADHRTHRATHRHSGEDGFERGCRHASSTAARSCRFSKPLADNDIPSKCAHDAASTATDPGSSDRTEPIEKGGDCAACQFVAASYFAAPVFLIAWSEECVPRNHPLPEICVSAWGERSVAPRAPPELF